MKISSKSEILIITHTIVLVIGMGIVTVFHKCPTPRETSDLYDFLLQEQHWYKQHHYSRNYTDRTTIPVKIKLPTDIELGIDLDNFTPESPQDSAACAEELFNVRVLKVSDLINYGFMLKDTATKPAGDKYKSYFSGEASPGNGGTYNFR